MSDSDSIRRRINKRSDTDKIKMDTAVDLVLKNKLSLRAASHLYKIPFSTLRTRKIFLSKNPEQNMCLSSKNKDTKDDDSEDIEDIEDENVEESEMDRADCNEEDQKLNNLTNVKSENSNNFKINFKRLVKNPRKRLYIKHDKLDSLFKTNGFLEKNEADIKTLLNKNLLSKLNSHKQNNKRGNSSLNNSSSSQKPYSSPIKLSSLFSNSILAKQQKSKNSEKVEQPDKSIEPSSSTSSSSSESTKEKSSHSVSLTSQEASVLDSLRKYLIKSNKSEETKANENSLLLKCNECKLMFIDARLLNDHISSACTVRKSKYFDLEPENEEVDDLYESTVLTCKYCKNAYPDKLSFMSHIIICGPK